MTTDRAPGQDPGRAARDAARARERAESRARQQQAYQRAQRASRSRALRAAADPARPAVGAEASARAEDRSPLELTPVELAEQRLEEAELQRSLLEALAALPSDQRVAVVAALGYDEGPAGAAVELDLDPQAAGRLAQQGLDALRHALTPFLTPDD